MNTFSFIYLNLPFHPFPPVNYYLLNQLSIISFLSKNHPNSISFINFSLSSLLPTSSTLGSHFLIHPFAASTFSSGIPTSLIFMPFLSLLLSSAQKIHQLEACKIYLEATLGTFSNLSSYFATICSVSSLLSSPVRISQPSVPALPCRNNIHRPRRASYKSYPSTFYCPYWLD